MTPAKKTQREKFEEAARELGADTPDDTFEAAVTKVAKAPKITDEEIKEFVRWKRNQSKD
jgi:hypothetical protein